MTYSVRHTAAFKRDYKLAIRRNLPIDKLQNGEELPAANRDHALTGPWANHRECHIAPNWLLIYQIYANVLVLELTRTGTHSDLFGK